MLERLRFKWYFYKAKYARALAFLKEYPCTNDELWACYMLGMYDTVAKASWDGRHLKGGFAFCVSLAATGRFKEAEDNAAALEKVCGFEKIRSKFASAIAIYMPSLALRITDSQNPPSHFFISLLIRQGEQTKAAKLLKNMKLEGELYLLKSNISAASPKEQLHALNSFLASYDLSGVSLIDSKKSVSAANIKCNSLRNAACSEKMPLVSILVTTYNTSSYIKSSLASLLSQTYKNLEIIVVDDKSTDDTLSKIKDISAHDSRIKIIANSVNTGTFAAKTLALQQASGEFIICHDSDDFAHSEWIARQVKPLLENRKLIGSVSQWIRVSDEGKYWVQKICPLSRLNRTSLLFRKSVLENTSSWDIVRTGADSEFHARLKLVFGKNAIKYIKLPLTIGAYREDSLTTSHSYGYDKNGISSARLKYWEAWMRWHIDCLKKGRKPTIPQHERPFPAPKEILAASE
ncbi:MAG: glycosyltransferase [Campylobacteraceae bacterium]|jgi:hypothetical protein|nr:glycosyltransferase [Campylobacteraceae bacterium]